MTGGCDLKKILPEAGYVSLFNIYLLLKHIFFTIYNYDKAVEVENSRKQVALWIISITIIIRMKNREM